MTCARNRAWIVAAALVALVFAACGRRTSTAGPSNDLLIVGYDREPDTLNRFSTHILEDIESCIVEGLVTTDDSEFFNRRLFLARKQFERSSLPGYVVSISSTTMIYKALCAGRLLSDFYPDLADPEFKTPFALFHQRYATNVLPSWERAQPFRCLAHNGEINTIWGNRARMEARAATLPLDMYPILTQGGSDSTSLDEII